MLICNCLLLLFICHFGAAAGDRDSSPPYPDLQHQLNALEAVHSAVGSFSQQLAQLQEEGGLGGSTARKNDSRALTAAIPVALFNELWTREIPAASLLGLGARGATDLVVSSSCVAGFARLFNNTSGAEGNASDGIRALDAFGRLGSGYLDGNNFAIGSYDGCLAITGTQFCLLHLVVSGKEFVYGAEGTLSGTILPNIFNGLCLPEECSLDDISAALNVTNERLASSGLKTSLSVLWDDSNCDVDKNRPLNYGAMIMIAVCCLLVFLVAAGSIADRISHRRNVLAARRKRLEQKMSKLSASISMDNLGTHTTNTSPEEKLARFKFNRSNSCTSTLNRQNPTANLMRSTSKGAGEKRISKMNRVCLKCISPLSSFSLFKTIPAILATGVPSSAIKCIHGIRFFSMVWLILHHTLLWMILHHVPNNLIYAKEHIIPQIPSFILTNGFFAIDSFIFFSGLLVSYITLNKIKRSKGRFPFVLFYVHRLLRILPAYSFVLFFFWQLEEHMGDGPIWYQYLGPGKRYYAQCEKYWWSNLLFINNFYPWKLIDGCLNWGWYLAADMQMYVIAPLLLIPLYYGTLLGGVVAVAFLVASFIVTGTLTGRYDLKANLFLSGFESITHPNAINSLDVLYIKPWTKIPAFVIAVLLGYVLYRKYKFRLSTVWNNSIHTAMWIAAAFFCLSALYGVYPTWNGRQFTTAENVLYATLSPLSWALGIALIIYACHNGYGGVANRFLTLKVWVPLSKLTYLAYLINPIVLITLYGSTRQAIVLTYTTLLVYGLATVILSFAAAFVLACCVEIPFSTLELTIFKMVGLAGRSPGHHKRKCQENKGIETSVVIQNIPEETEADSSSAQDSSQANEASSLDGTLSSELTNSLNASEVPNAPSTVTAEGLSDVATGNGISSGPPNAFMFDEKFRRLSMPDRISMLSRASCTSSRRSSHLSQISDGKIGHMQGRRTSCLSQIVEGTMVGHSAKTRTRRSSVPSQISENRLMGSSSFGDCRHNAMGNDAHAQRSRASSLMSNDLEAWELMLGKEMEDFCENDNAESESIFSDDSAHVCDTASMHLEFL